MNLGKLFILSSLRKKMNKEDWKQKAIGLTAIAIAIIPIINQDFRSIATLILGLAIVFYIANSFMNILDSYDSSINKLKEELNIYKELIGIKSDIKILKQKIK